MIVVIIVVMMLIIVSSHHHHCHHHSQSIFNSNRPNRSSNNEHFLRYCTIQAWTDIIEPVTVTMTGTLDVIAKEPL